MKLGTLTWRLVLGSFLQWFGMLMVLLAPLGLLAGVVRLRYPESDLDARFPQVTLLALVVGHCATAVGGALWWKAGCWIRSRRRSGRAILAVVALGYLAQAITMLSGVVGPLDTSTRQRPSFEDSAVRDRQRAKLIPPGVKNDKPLVHGMNERLRKSFQRNSLPRTGIEPARVLPH